MSEHTPSEQKQESGPDAISRFMGAVDDAFKELESARAHTKGGDYLDLNNHIENVIRPQLAKARQMLEGLPVAAEEARTQALDALADALAQTRRQLYRLDVSITRIATQGNAAAAGIGSRAVHQLRNALDDAIRAVNAAK